MIPKIELLTEKKLIGIRLSMSFSDNKTGALWKMFLLRRNEIENTIGSNLYSIQYYDPMFFVDFNTKTVFDKWAAVEVSNHDIIPKNMEAIILGRSLYAVFHYKGLPSNGETMFRYIFESWLPNSGYRLDNRPHFEILGDKYKNDSPNSEEDIWIPIIKK